MAILKFGPADGDEQKEILLDQVKVTIGRADDNVCPLKDNAASRYHAEISKTETVFMIKDLGSSNGTWVNRERIQVQPLADGDEIKIGGTTFFFSDPETTESTVMIDMAGMQIEDPSSVQPAPPSPLPPVAPPIEAPLPPVAPPIEASPPPVAPAVQPPPIAPPPVQPPPPVAPLPPARPEPPEIKASSAKKPVNSAMQSSGDASFWERFAAYLIDSIILSIAVMVVLAPPTILAGFVATKSQGAALFLSLIGSLLGITVGLGYFLVQWARTGTTPGKKMLKIKIVREDGVEPLGYKTAVLRLLGYVASGMIFYLGFIMVAFNKEHKGLHDMIAGTRVIKS